VSVGQTMRRSYPKGYDKRKAYWLPITLEKERKYLGPMPDGLSARKQANWKMWRRYYARRAAIRAAALAV